MLFPLETDSGHGRSAYGDITNHLSLFAKQRVEKALLKRAVAVVLLGQQIAIKLHLLLCSQHSGYRETLRDGTF